MVDPAILTRGGINRIKRIINTIVFFVRLTHDQQTYLFTGVIDKGVTHAGDRRETDAVARLQLQ